MCREMKDSGVQWIGNIPKEWEVIRTKNIYSNSKTIVGNKAESYARLALTLNGVIKRSKEDSNGLQPEKFEGYQILKENELVFKLIDLENIATSRVGFSPYIGLVSPAYIILDNERHSRFGYYYFISMYYQQIFNKLGGDGVRSNLNAKDLLNIPYLNVSEEERNRIANYLDKKVTQIDDIISKQKSLIKKYKAYKQSLITETVTKGLNKNASMKDSGVEWIGEIPSHWDVTITKNISNKITDGAHVSPETENGVYDFISVVNLDNNFINFNECLKTSEVSYRQMVKNGCKPQRGDILISKDGTVGKSVVIDYDREFVIASSLVIVTPNKKMISYFLNYLIQSNCVQEQLNSFMKGSGLKRVSVKNNGKLYVTVPSISEQEDIVAFLDKKCNAIDSAIDKKEQLIEKLESYKKSLIYECVTGKREVS